MQFNCVQFKYKDCAQSNRKQLNQHNKIYGRIRNKRNRRKRKVFETKEINWKFSQNKVKKHV